MKKMKAIKKTIILLFTLILFFLQVHPTEIIKRFKIIKIFPTEEQMDKHDFVLVRGTRFAMTKDSIFFCSQFEHKIFKFDLDGNYLLKFGNSGQGPGDFNKPKKVYAYKDSLYISDNGNSRFVICSFYGEYKNQIKMLNPIHDFVIVDDKLFILMPGIAGNSDRENTPVFGIFNLKGELINKITGSFHSQYNDFITYDNQVRMKVYNKLIHCLQEYGTTYRIYNIDGNLVNEFELGKNPLNDKEYKKLNYYFAYQIFAVNEKKIYASCAAKGKILIDVFDMTGKFLFKYENKMDMKDSIYDVTDMKIIKRQGKTLIYLLIFAPEIEFMIAELN